MPKRTPNEQELMELLQMLQGVMSPGDLLPDPAFEDPDELRREISALPLRPEIHWLGFIAPLEMGALPLPEGFTPHLAVLMRPEGPEASLSELAEDREEAELMLLQDILEPDDAEVEVYRPGTLLVPDVQQAFALGNFLREAGIRVEVEPMGELAKMRDHLITEFGREAAAQTRMLSQAMQPQPILTGLSDEQVREFVEAFRRFDRAEAWEVVEPDRPISATWTDAQGQPQTVYATAMGDMGESYGLVFFADWLAYAEQMNNSFNHELVVRGLGGMEAVTEGEQTDFTDEDWARLRALGLVTGRQKTAPTLQRLGLEGSLPPRTPLLTVTAMLNVLATRAEKKPGARATSIKGVAGGVQVRYPGKPQDELRPEELTGTVTLTFTGGRWLQEGEVLTISGPAGESVSRVKNAFHKQLEASKERRLQSVFGFRFTRPLPDAEPDVDDYFGEQELRVWEQGLGSTTVLMSQLTRRTGLESFNTKVQATFSPEPSSSVTWTLKKA